MVMRNPARRSGIREKGGLIMFAAKRLGTLETRAFKTESR
jgi:hypothetical protein